MGKELTKDDKQILSEFQRRRKLFDTYLKNKNKKKFTCPSCGFPILNERETYEICDICDWEDDWQDDPIADEVLGGPNGNLSLTGSRLKIGNRLKKLEKRLKGKIVIDPIKFFEILERHEERMKEISSKIKGAHINDPLWKKWKKIKGLIKLKLINKKS